MENSEFKTCDLGIATFLLTHQVAMRGISREQDHLLFEFAKPALCQKLALEFMAGNDRVSAKALLAAGKHLRRLVRENL